VVTRQHPRSTRLLVVTLVTISLAVITLDYRQGQNGPLAGLGRGALTVIVPMQRAVTDVTRPVGNFFSGLAHLPSLQSENQSLRTQLRTAQAALAEANYREELLLQLESLNGLKKSLTPSGVIADVTGSGPSPFAWTATIDKGSADGIAINAPVVVGSTTSSMLVGHIVQVASHAASVQFIIDPGSSVQGMLSTSHQAGIVVGQGPSDMKMTLVNPGTQIAGNEPVLTQGYCVSGQPGLYPPGLLIGTVSRTLPSTNAIQQAVTVRPAADFTTLPFVLVLKVRTHC